MDAKGTALDRRRSVRIGGLGLALGAAPMLPAAALAQKRASGPIPGLLDGFLALPGTKAAQVDVGDGAKAWRVTHAADAGLFCGSCFKTFVLATYLREVEAGRLSLESEQLTIDDRSRSTGGAVFEYLTGTTQARIVLEAMIAHSDNTADRRRHEARRRRRGAPFISDAGLTRRASRTTRGASSPTSPVIRRATTLGRRAWGPVVGKPTSGPRCGPSTTSTHGVPAADFVAYYKRALAGAIFKKPETLTEFKRIQAMADAIAMLVPADTPPT